MSSHGSGPLRLAAVAVAASAGGVEALSRLVGLLPAELDAAVFVVLHIPATSPSVLPDILRRFGDLPASHAVHGQPYRPGEILVAPPDHHLAVAGGLVELSRAPKQNGHRPSADVLLQSVAREFGTRAAAIVLSGTMDDGVVGLQAVESVGGYTMVQDPDDAAFPGMPAAAIRATHPSFIGTVGEIAEHLSAWVDRPGDAGHGPAGGPVGTGAHLGAPSEQVGTLSEFTCPECGGTLWNVEGQGLLRFRCRVGHAYSAESLFAGKQQALEAAIYAAVVALEERADLSRRILKRIGTGASSARIARYEQDLHSTEAHAETLRKILEQVVEGLPVPDNDLKEEGAAS